MPPLGGGGSLTLNPNANVYFWADEGEGLISIDIDMI